MVVVGKLKGGGKRNRVILGRSNTEFPPQQRLTHTKTNLKNVFLKVNVPQNVTEITVSPFSSSETEIGL